MAWTAPMTAVANTAFTAAQYNQFVRDNFLETAPAKALNAGAHFVATGANAIAQRRSFRVLLAEAESTSSTSFTDLGTTGPSISVVTGTSCFVAMNVEMENDAANAACFATYAVTGATTIAAQEARRIRSDGLSANTNALRIGAFTLQTGLTPGLNTFTMKYRVSSSTGIFRNRELVCIGM